jgi:hypothetical protein
LFYHAVEVNDHVGGASLAQAIEKNVMRGAQLAGEWQPGPTVQNNVAIFNLPGMAATIAGIARVLAPFPEARLAVAEFLRQQPTAPPLLEVQDAAAD